VRWHAIIAGVADGWAIAGTVAVAGSAIVTAAMAWYTRSVAQRTADVAALTRAEVEAIVRQGEAIEQQAAATTEQVRLAEAALAPQVQPWLTLGDARQIQHNSRVALAEGQLFSGTIPPLIVSASNERLAVVLVVRNVGNGLAIIDSRASCVIGWTRATGGDEQSRFTQPAVATPVLPPGEQARVEYVVNLSGWGTDIETITHRENTYGEFALDVVYSDALGQRTSRLRVHIAGTEDQKLVAHRLDYYTPAESDILLTSVRVGSASQDHE